MVGEPGDGIVDQWGCDKHEIIVATDTSHSGVKVWTDAMKKEGQGYGLLGDKYVVLTSERGTQNQLWDILGADDERIDFSD